VLGRAHYWIRPSGANRTHAARVHERLAAPRRCRDDPLARSSATKKQQRFDPGATVIDLRERGAGVRVSLEERHRRSGECLIEELRECTPRCDIGGDGCRRDREDTGCSVRRLAERASNSSCSHAAESAVSAHLNADRR
jgi:hypothetical protein